MLRKGSVFLKWPCLYSHSVRYEMSRVSFMANAPFTAHKMVGWCSFVDSTYFMYCRHLSNKTYFILTTAINFIAFLSFYWNILY